MPRKLPRILSAALIGLSVGAGTAAADFVLRDTLRPRDTLRSVRQAVREVSDGALRLEQIAGVHHPRTFKDGQKGVRQANTATIYARVSGLGLDRALLSFPCEHFEDGRWLCSAWSVQLLVDPDAEVPPYFYLER